MAFALSTLRRAGPLRRHARLSRTAPGVHRIAKRTKVYSIADPGLTQAFEFSDGKLMFGQHGTVHEVSWETLKKAHRRCDVPDSFGTRLILSA